MKTYVLTVSRNFSVTHKRKGEHTFFPEMILSALGKHELLTSTCFAKPPEKIHTIRANYEYWKKRIEEVQRGEAILSVRYWSGKPYNSKQVTFCNLTKDDGVGIQKLTCSYMFGMAQSRIDNSLLADFTEVLSKNDGLSLEDFNDWFRKYDLSKPMAIIHFTNFRY